MTRKLFVDVVDGDEKFHPLNFKCYFIYIFIRTRMLTNLKYIHEDLNYTKEANKHHRSVHDSIN